MDAVKELSWTMAVVVAVVLIVRQATKAMIFRKVGLDDGFILLASVLAISLSVTTLALAADSRDVSASSTSEQADIISKGYYASELFFVSAVCFPKLSILVLFYDVVAGKRFIRRVVLTLGALILAWTLASLITVAFQCGLPHPWETAGSYCINARIFWIVYCTIDVLTEIAIVAIPAKIVAYTQMQLPRKIAVVLCFAPRVLVVGAALTRLVWLYPLAAQYDRQHRIWEPMISSQVQTCLSVITASLPFILPYCRELDSRLQTSGLKVVTRRANDEETAYSRSSLWFRRYYKSRSHKSQDPTTEKTVAYELVPRASPYISFARPTTPRSITRLQLSPEAKTSLQGLNIYIPHRSVSKQSDELVSPRSQSASRWSPWSTSPQALLLHSFIPSRKAPIPPPKTPCVSPPSPSSCYSSRSATPAFSSAHTQPSLLFSPSQSVVGTPQAQKRTSPPLGDKTTMSMHSMPDRIIAHYSAKPSPRIPSPREIFSHKLSQHISSSNSGTKACLKTTPLPTLDEHKSRPDSIQDLTSPMGAAIHSWFNSPNTQRLPQFSPITPLSARDSFDQYMASPAESLSMPTYPLFTHTRSPARSTVFLNESSPSHNLYHPSHASETSSTPLVRDVRNNPRVVVRNVL